MAAIIRALTRDESDAILQRNVVGRIAFTFKDRVDIQPIHYVYEAGWIYGRTSEGAKLATLAHRRWLAFEVDEVRGILDWASVVVQGTFYRIEADDSSTGGTVSSHAVELLRALVPETLSADDPVPFRTVLFRIAVDTVTGRLAMPLDTTNNSAD